MNGRHSNRPASRVILSGAAYPLDYREATAQFHRLWLIKALRRFRGNLSETARQLGLTRRALQLQVARLDIDLGPLRNGK
ncbi:MAG: hypothetical protein IPK53_04210 [bacterium]|nr:hypothetical protein [bacterium]MBK8128162.1 hypothetical protein [bacterium]